MQRSVVGMIAELRFRNQPSPPPRKSRHKVNRFHEHRRIVGAREPLHGHHPVAGSNGYVQVVILEEEALAGIAGGKRQPQAVPAVRLDPRGAEAVAIRFDVNVPSGGCRCRKARDPRRHGRTRQENRQRRQSPNRAAAGFRRRRRLWRCASRTVGAVPQNGKRVGGRSRSLLPFNCHRYLVLSSKACKQTTVRSNSGEHREVPPSRAGQGESDGPGYNMDAHSGIHPSLTPATSKPASPDGP